MAHLDRVEQVHAIQQLVGAEGMGGLDAGRVGLSANRGGVPQPYRSWDADQPQRKYEVDAGCAVHHQLAVQKGVIGTLCRCDLGEVRIMA